MGASESFYPPVLPRQTNENYMMIWSLYEDECRGSFPTYCHVDDEGRQSETNTQEVWQTICDN